VQTLSVIIPFFNENQVMRRLIDEICQIPKGVVNQYIFVDDGSSDESLKTLKECLQETELPATILSKNNGGKASAICEAITHLKSSHALILDADLELSPADIVNLWEVVTSEKSDVVFGYREFLSHSSFTYRYARGNRLISHFYGLLYNEVITDIMCGFKLLPKALWEAVEFKHSNFAIEVEIPLMLWRRRIRPFEIKVQYSPRSRANGKIIGLKDAMQIFLILIVTRFRHLRRH
jgi:glycosyltransferase involved in cell wall biosynthesis